MRPTTNSAELVRPRIESGVASWTIVVRNTTESTSAAPATASSASELGRLFTAPNPASAAPQMQLVNSIARPGRTTCWLSAVNQAPGVLLERGIAPVLGRRELQRRATVAGASIPAAARALVANVAAADPDTWSPILS